MPLRAEAMPSRAEALLPHFLARHLQLNQVTLSRQKKRNEFLCFVLDF